METQKIPKIIHYCWFGKKELPSLEKVMLKTWKEKLPDYELIKWDEERFDIKSQKYVKEAYEKGKYAFVSDYVRLYALYQYGGIYMDTDVEVLKDLSPLLENDGFIGFESIKYIGTSLIAAKPNNQLIKALLESYKDKTFIKDDGTLNITTNVQYITSYLQSEGIILNNHYQKIEHFSIYPKDFFSPKSLVTGKIKCTSNTYTIHHFSASWMDSKDKLKIKISPVLNILRKVLIAIIGEDNFNKIRLKIKFI
ncbi:glycosyl transferase [Sporanaerobium hydrogeniformans]|uniref:Glycosyl transferase n=1 Tax=Sporanaerobium hydrogeniformans TaxID=3072179 RepID=A0AC61DAT6_9FIRM|nr:glycosyltransferase [Sporanaerobium hydrogeniformans]PHV70152.1 glycosyl transferase [Sporanaerobium hydrogeniformans]